MAKSQFAVGCNKHNTMKDKKIQSFSFPNNNDKHFEISVFAVTLVTYGNALPLLCQQLSNTTVRKQKKISVLIC